MKKCKECKSKELEHKFAGNTEEVKCNNCGLIAHRVMIGNGYGKWGYFKENKLETTPLR